MTASDLTEQTIRYVSTFGLGGGALALVAMWTRGHALGRERWFLDPVDKVGTWVTRLVVLSVTVALGAHAYVEWYNAGRLWLVLGATAALAAGGGRAFCDELDRLVRATLTTDYWDISLPNRLDTAAAKSPVLSAYQAALNLLDAEALFSDLRIRDLLDPTVTAPRSVERHHLFPKKYLSTRGITGIRHVNAIANMAYLDWPENAAVGADDGQFHRSVHGSGHDDRCQYEHRPMEVPACQAYRWRCVSARRSSAL